MKSLKMMIDEEMKEEWSEKIIPDEMMDTIISDKLDSIFQRLPRGPPRQIH